MHISRKLINILLALQLLTLCTVAAGQDSESQTVVSEDPPVVHKRKHPAAAARFAEDDAERYNLLKESAAVGAASVNGIHEDAWTPEHVLTFMVPPGLDQAVKLFQHIDAAGEGDIIRGNVITASADDKLDMTISQPGKDTIWSGRDLEEGSWKFFALYVTWAWQVLSSIRGMHTHTHSALATPTSHLPGKATMRSDSLTLAPQRFK